MKKIKIAIIGAGYIADYHARGLQALPNVEIAIVIDTQSEAAENTEIRIEIQYKRGGERCHEPPSKR